MDSHIFIATLLVLTCAHSGKGTELSPVHNLGLALSTQDGSCHPYIFLLSRSAVVVDKWAVFGVHEASQGRDLNGDGDGEDVVLHLHDLENGITRNLETAIALHSMMVPVGHRWVAFHLYDPDEEEFALLDLQTFEIRPLDSVEDLLYGYISYVAPVALGDGPGLMFYTTSEDKHRAVLYDPENGQAMTLFTGEEVLALDGRTLVTSSRLRDLASGASFPIPPAMLPWVSLSGDWLAFEVSEAGQGFVDLNGDGDTQDNVLHVLNLETAEIRNFGIAGYLRRAHCADCSSLVLAHTNSLSLRDGWLAYALSEADQGGVDRNGDGDAGDWTLMAIDLEHDRTISLGPVSGGRLGSYSDVFYGFHKAPDGTLWLSSFDYEEGLRLFDLESNRSIRLNAAYRHEAFLDTSFDRAAPFEPSFTSLVIPRDATAIFAADETLHLADLESGTSWNTSVGFETHAALAANDLLVWFDWRAQAGHAYDLKRRREIPLLPSRCFWPIAASERWVLLSVTEDAADLNGDGDVQDEVIFAVGVGLSTERPQFHRGDPNASGTTDISDGITIFGLLFLGDPFALTCRESADTNNDGTIDISDGIYLLSWLFTGGPEPVAPGPSSRPCGVDPDELGSPGDLGCVEYSPCQ